MLALSTIKATGPDAFDFLQGQLTNDLRGLKTGDVQRNAWCSPKGRVIWFGELTAIDGGFALSVPADRAEDIVRRLSMFRFRSKVDFEVVDGGAGADPAALIAAGIPWIGEAQSEEFTPHMLNLDLLDAISLDKGCYTGQEIVARTHYKGATKRRTLRFRSATPLQVGDKVELDDRKVGEVLNVAGDELLAVIATDNADQAHTVGDVTLSRRPLPYL